VPNHILTLFQLFYPDHFILLGAFLYPYSITKNTTKKVVLAGKREKGKIYLNYFSDYYLKQRFNDIMPGVFC
jgi:hypothetical protein